MTMVVMPLQEVVREDHGRGDTSGGTIESGAGRGDATNGIVRVEKGWSGRGRGGRIMGLKKVGVEEVGVEELWVGDLVLKEINHDDIRQSLDHKYLQTLLDEYELIKRNAYLEKHLEEQSKQDEDNKGSLKKLIKRTLKDKDKKKHESTKMINFNQNWTTLEDTDQVTQRAVKTTLSTTWKL
uniref:Uncharacterized protein n=1 Tax=Tanacetum cinerariifolium TaxID=118510 RepID=A0A699L295_TANCI|nr:hypothetical protein [Tanacetum cinerariifolium]